MTNFCFRVKGSEEVSASATSDNETVMLLTAQSVKLAAEGGTGGVQCDGYPATAELIGADPARISIRRKDHG